MLNTKFGYAAEKLNAAIRGLMAPHPGGVAESFAGAFHECYLGLKDINPSDLDENAATWMKTILRTMDTTGLQDPSGRGTFSLRAEKLSDHEMSAFSTAVYELAFWFDSRSARPR